MNAPARHGAGSGLRRLADDVYATLPAWVTARLVVAASMLSARLVADGLMDDVDRPMQVGRGLMAWDGDWYRALVDFGYDGVRLEGVRFFPGLMLLGRLFDLVLPGGSMVALLVVANTGALAAGVLLRRLVLAETADPRLADRAVWLLALFPSAFVLVWGYAEGPFLAVAIGALLALRHGRLSWVAALTLGAGLLRPTGVLLALPVLVAVWRQRHGATGRQRLGGIAAVLGGPIGAGSYVAWASLHFDDPLIPLTVQRDLRGAPIDPFSRLYEGLGELFGAEVVGDGLHIPFAVGFLVVGVVLLRSWPARYGIFALACLATALAADNLNSLERYALNGFPVVMGLATVAGHRRLRVAVPVLSAGCMFALGVLASLGRYVP